MVTLGRSASPPKTTLANFTRNTAAGICDAPAPTDKEWADYAAYLELLYKCFSSCTVASGALIVQVIADRVEYLPLDDVRDIIFTPRQTIERAERLELMMQQDYARGRELLNQYRIDRNISNELKIQGQEHGIAR